MDKKRLAKNVLTGIIAQIFILLFSLLTRIFLIKYIGIEATGLTNLFTSVLSVVSIVEIGLSAIIPYTMYKAIIDNNIFIFEGYAKPNKESTLKTFKNHIMSNSTIIHDLDGSHSILFDVIPNLRSKEYKSIISKYVEDKKNPLYPINHMQMLLKKFMSAHSGFNRDNIQDWLNLFSFMMNPPFDRDEKIIELIKLMVNTRITLRFKKNKCEKS